MLQKLILAYDLCKLYEQNKLRELCTLHRNLMNDLKSVEIA